MDTAAMNRINYTHRWGDGEIREWLHYGDESNLRSAALLQGDQLIEVVTYGLSRLGPVNVMVLPGRGMSGVQMHDGQIVWVEAADAEAALRQALPVLPPNCYDIPTALMHLFDHKIELLNRKAARLKVPPASYTVIGTERRPLRREGEAEPYAYQEWSIVQVEGGPIKLAGWRFLATLDFSDPALAKGQYALRLAPGVETLPVRWRTNENNPTTCDHCGKVRGRAQTYVVQHEDGRAQQVGSSCLSSFLGGASAQSIAAWFSALWKFSREVGGADEESEGSWGGSSIPLSADLKQFVERCATAIRATGYVSGGEARDKNTMSTGDYVWSVTFPYGPIWTKEAKELKDAQTKGDLALAAEALEWLPTLWGDKPDTELTDFQRNMKAYTSAGLVSAKSKGYAASIIPVYRRWQEKEVERRRTQKLSETSKHQGESGKRTEWVATISALREIEGMYGVKTMVKMVTDDGSVLVWWATGNPKITQAKTKTQEYAEYELSVGVRVAVRGTVKKHGEYRGTQETTLSRCILSTVG